MIKFNNLNGFTLIELLIAMAITGIVSAAIFTAFQSQQNSYLIQDDTVVMQQNLRAGMDMMVREIRMAGCDPTGNANAQIKRAESDLIYLTMDVIGGEDDGSDNDGDGLIDEPDQANDGIDNDGDGLIDESDEEDEKKYSDGDTDDSNEDITYSLYTSDGIQKLGRKSPATANNQPVAENIEALGFAYAFDADGDSIIDMAGGNIIWAINKGSWYNLDTNNDGKINNTDIEGGTDTGIPVNLDDIRAVKIWLLAKADRRDNKYFNTRTYVVGHKVITPKDNFRRRLLTTTVKCRNLGL